MDHSSKFSDLCEQYVQFMFDECPEFATYKGISRGQDDKLDSFALDFYENRKKYYENTLEKLSAIERSELELQDQISADLLEHALKTAIDGFRYKAHLTPFNSTDGPDIYFTRFTLSRTTFNTTKDYADYIARLEAIPKQISESMELCRIGLKEGIVGHKTVEPFIINRLTAVVQTDLEKLPHFEPFTRLPEVDIEEEQRKSLYAIGKELMQRCVMPAHVSLLNFMEKEYVPRLRIKEAIGSVAGPPGAYETYLRYYCNTEQTPQELHELGRKEVESIMEDLNEVMKKVNYIGDAKSFAEFVQEKEDFYFDDISDIQPYCKHVINHVIRPKLHILFKEFKDVPFEFTEIRGRTTTRGMYSAPPVDDSKPGNLKLWISPDFAKFEVIPLMLHEILPGHHLQACVIQGNVSLPLFRTVKDDRRYFDAPGRTPMYTAYTEGWGLYCEYLGNELGLYDNPYDEFGYLFYKLSRAVRVVADTGIHGLGWGREELQCYIDEHAPLATQTMTEFPRYVIKPAQAAAYTLGFLKIKELREKAENTLRDRFDVRDFHQELLECGPVTVQIMEKIIDMYIQRVKDSN